MEAQTSFMKAAQAMLREMEEEEAREAAKRSARKTPLADEGEDTDWSRLEKLGKFVRRYAVSQEMTLSPGAVIPFRFRSLSVPLRVTEKTLLPQRRVAPGEELCVIGEPAEGRECLVCAAAPGAWFDRFRAFENAEEKLAAMRRYAGLPPEEQERLAVRLAGERYPIARGTGGRALRIDELLFRFQLCRDTFTPRQQRDIEALFEKLSIEEGDVSASPIRALRKESKTQRRLRYLLNIDQSSAAPFTMTKEELISALDKRLFGLREVKEKIAEAVVAAKYAGKKGFAILLVGSPGVGKTSIIRAVAEVLGRPWFIVSLSSSSSLVDLVGDAPHFESADCGEVARRYYEIGTTEAVVGLDEFDKPYQSEKEGGGRNTKVFQEALSDEHVFRDAFLGAEINTGNTLFIATANTTEHISESLLNRFTVISIPDYTEEEKVEIARRHILPELMSEYRLAQGEIRFSDSVLLSIAREYCEDEGARDMKKHLRSLVSRVLSLWDSGGGRQPFSVSEEFVASTLAAAVDENSPAILFRRNRGAYSPAVAAEIRSLIAKCRRDDLPPQDRERHEKRLGYLVRLIPTGGAFTQFDSEAFYRRVNETHCGMESVKDTVAQIFYLNSLRRRPLTSIRLLLVGPPGVGKTSVAASIAGACGAQLQRVSLNGVSDDAVLKGHSPTYLGSDAGMIAKALYRMRTTRGILLLDEIDKLGSRGGAEAINALVDLLDDSAQFTDHFLGLPLDLSQTLFLATANDLSAVPPLLRDRFTVLTLEGYSEREKEEILGSYIIPRVAKEYCPEGLDVRFPPETRRLLLASYCRSMGVRDADRAVRRLVREKLFSLRGSGETEALVTPGDVERVLGCPPPVRGNFPETVYPGLSRALAVAGDGCGMTFSVETMLLPGESALTLTGLPQESTADSVRLALSFVKRRWPGALREQGVHVHFGEGSVEKDGPSAGVAILLSLLSAVFGETVDGRVACTGEINGNGCVFPVGGVRAKLRAAEQAGCTRVFLPQENFRELSQQELSRLRVEAIPVRHVDEVIAAVFPRLAERAG